MFTIHLEDVVHFLGTIILREGFHFFPHRSNTHGEHELHRFRVVHVVETAGKVDCITAHLLVLVEPQITPDGHLLPVVQPRKL